VPLRTREGLRRFAARAAMIAALALSVTAAAGAQAASAAPVNLSPPIVKGKTTDGKKLIASPGSWSGGKPSFSYAWERCDEAGQNCAPVPGAGASYVTSDADVGHRLVAIVTATNGDGSAAQATAPSAKIAPVGPRKKKAPTVSGTTQDGQMLSASTGTWRGTGPLSFAYQWESCHGRACAPIPGATKQSYRASTADLTKKLRVIVTASNVAGSGTATSKPSAVITPGAPVNVAAPSVSGLPIVEQVLTADPGTWAGTGPFTYTYQWRGCSLLGGCEDISGAHEPTYTVGPLEIANTIEVEVTAHSAHGSATTTSPPTNLIEALLPQNLLLPRIEGLLQDGGLLSAVAGTWSGSEPLGYSVVWELCDAAGVSCKEIFSGALGSTLGLIAGDIGSTVRVIVTATNSAGSTSATSEPTSLIKGLLPSNTGLPSIVGSLLDGSTLTGATGTWSGSEPLSFSRVWELCDAAGQNCEAIEGAAGPTLGLLTSMIGSTVRLAVTATNSTGSQTAHSEPTSLIKGLVPSNTGLPSITGLLQDGSALTAVLGSWSGSEPLSFSRVWELCDSAGQNCKAIEGAVGSTLGLIAGEIGSTVRLAVTATNSAGSSTATSEPTSLIKGLLPSNTGLPSILGSLIDGSALTGAVGSWSGSEPLSFSRQWLVCDGSGGSCKEISGATGTTLGLLTGMIGSTVREVVTATNGAGSTSATSAPTSVIKALPPSNTGLPSIVGSLIDGSSLTGAKGSWTGSEPSFGYQWLLCDSTGGSCKEVSGATGTTLGLLTSMIGSTTRLVVTASNSAGSTSATSEPTSVIKALLPSNTGLPSIVGSLIDGSALTGAVGGWSGSEPLSFSRQWLLCDGSGGSCKEISGATATTLGLLTGMIGSTVREVVTATNGAGSTSATSEPTSVIKALLPSNIGLPSIAGSLIDGSSLTGAKGSWTGSEPSFSYQWLVCNSSGASCKEISGATGTTLGLLTSMIGSTTRLVVTATNGAGSTSATSAPTSVIKALLPSNTGLPSITGSLIDGSALTGAVGGWSGSEPLSFSRQWLLCNSSGGSCKEISGATGSTLGLLTGMIGSTVREVVTATNGAGSTSATSEPTSVIKALLPSNTALPSIGGLLEDGQSLTGAKGSWTGSEPSFGYQWLLCNSSGASCKEISGATGTTLGLLTSMIGSTVKLAVTATNSAGSTTATSNASSPILAILPKNTALPSITGLVEAAQTVTGAKGSWSGSEPTFTYQWLLCNSSGASCNEISGATATTLGLLESQIGKTVRLAVTATNSRGATTATSEPTSSILAILPANSAVPTIAGILQVGKVLEAGCGRQMDGQHAAQHHLPVADLRAARQRNRMHEHRRCRLETPQTGTAPGGADDPRDRNRDQCPGGGLEELGDHEHRARPALNPT
jgi:hypothetical protein